MTNIPKLDLQKVESAKNLFIQEIRIGNLKIRVAVGKSDHIVACVDELIRKEYALPLVAEESLLGWIIGVYTLEKHRNNGLAHKLVEETLRIVSIFVIKMSFILQIHGIQLYI